jgi:hypothetical protein
VTAKDREDFERLLRLAIEHANTSMIWLFLSIISAIVLEWRADTVFDACVAVAGFMGAAMAAVNARWSVQSLSASHAIVKRYKP